VASGIDGYRGVLEDGREGLLVQPEDERCLADALVRLLQDPALRERMGRQGQAKAADYSWDKVAQQVLDYYRELLEKKRR